MMMESDVMDVSFPNLTVTVEEAGEIVRLCQQFKRNAIETASEKKQTLQTCYAYTKGHFVGGDLLPVPVTRGAERDAQTNRPKVFIPLVRQQVKQIYSYLKLVIFPNDADFFRVKGKTPEAARFEEALTEALKNIFQNSLLSEKLGAFLYNLVWAGNAAALPIIRDEVVWEWTFDPQTQAYVAVQKELPLMPDVEVLNPIQFYIDPAERDLEKASWGYFTSKKLQEILDSQLYFNKEGLERFVSKSSVGQRPNRIVDFDAVNALQPMSNQIQQHLDYDLYYFPYFETSVRTYRNMLIGIAGEQQLIRFHPNIFPKGLNPVVFCNWMPDVDTPYGTGPVEDIKELQRLINILYNYMIELLARIGNRFKATEGVDLTNLFGVAGGVAIMPPGGEIESMTGDYAEPRMIADLIGTIKAEAQITSGSQNPFQGAASVDFKKTATELQILQENSISVMREIIEHVSVMGIQRILDRLMILCADLLTQPMTVRVESPKEGTTFKTIDLGLLKSGDFTIELVGVNPSQSKQAQVAGLMQLLELVSQSPQAILMGESIIRKIGELQGIRNIQDILNEIKQQVSSEPEAHSDSSIR